MITIIHDPLSSTVESGAQVLEAAPNFDVKKKLKLVGESESSEHLRAVFIDAVVKAVSIAVELAAC